MKDKLKKVYDSNWTWLLIFCFYGGTFLAAYFGILPPWIIQSWTEGCP